MSASVYLHPEIARRRAEVEASGGTLWIRVDSDSASWTPTSVEMVNDMRRALDEIELHLKAQEAA